VISNEEVARELRRRWVLGTAGSEGAHRVGWAEAAELMSERGEDGLIDRAGRADADQAE
jgi:hypothetical protein